LSEISTPKNGVRVSVRQPTDRVRRRIVQTSLGVQVFGASYPHVDPNDTRSISVSILKRVGSRPVDTPIHRGLRHAFRGHVRKWCRENISPLPATDNLLFADWLERTNYPERRKQHLRSIYANLDTLGDRGSVRNTRVKCFVKDECYAGFKHARSIYARVDEFKVRVGPFFKKFEDELYRHSSFIKHVPVSERAAYVCDKLDRGTDALYIATDYTAFESHFDKRLLEDCEFSVYEHFAGNNAIARDIVQFYTKTVSGLNRCEFKNITAFIPASRMSGEMSTSCGNGFTNYMVFTFIGRFLGLDSVMDAVIEGDDCLGRVAERRYKLCEHCVGQWKGPKGPYLCPVLVPQSDCAVFHRLVKYNIVRDIHSSVLLVDVMPLVYRLLGFNVKIEFHRDISRAGFCSMIFDKSVRVVVPEPMKKIMNLGWISSKYHTASDKTKMELLRGKAMSLMAECRGVPILQALAMRLMDLTSTHKYKIHDHYLREKLKKSLLTPLPVHPLTRQLMEDVFKFSYHEQLSIERYFACIGIERLNHYVLQERFTPEQILYDRYFVYDKHQGDYPSITLPVINSSLKQIYVEFTKASERRSPRKGRGEGEEKSYASKVETTAASVC